MNTRNGSTTSPRQCRSSLPISKRLATSNRLPFARALCLLIASLSALIGTVSVGTVSVWSQENIHPLSRPGHPAQGSSPRQYATSLLERHREAQELLARSRTLLRNTGRDLQTYQTGGTSAPFALASDRSVVDGMRQRIQLREVIIPGLEAELTDIEQEWNEWCKWRLRLGTFSDFLQLTEEQKASTLRWLDGQVWDRGIDQMVPYREPPAAPRPAKDPPKRLGWVADGSRAIIVRDNANLDTGSNPIGTRIMQGSGNWVGAAEGWQVDRGAAAEARPRNDPATLGPFVVAPGKYRAIVKIPEPRRGGMRASNTNTTMSVDAAPTGIPQRSARSVASLAVAADGVATEAQQEFTVRSPAQIWVTFGPATDRGPSGAWRQPEQAYVGYVELIEQAPEQAAVWGGDILPGDKIRAGGHAVTVELWDGTMVVVQPNSEITVNYPPDGMGIRVTLERGGARVGRHGIAYQNIEFMHKGRLVKPKGTDFILDDSGVAVISGAVEVSGEGEPLILNAGEKLNYRTATVEPFEAAGAGLVRAADGIPAEPEFWSPSRTPFGEKPFSLTDAAAADGWVLADPPERRGVRAEVEFPESGVLRVTVPANSRLDCGHYAADTAPRLLHKVTGDFDLEAEVSIAGQPGHQASLDFLVRAPGAYPGLLASRSPGQWGGNFLRTDGVGRSYWIPGSALVRRGRPAASHQPLLNVPHTQWPTVGDNPLRVRFSRRSDIWATSWSREEGVWESTGLHTVQLPETLWIGWLLENATFSGPANPVTYTLREVRLHTAPYMTMDTNWHVSTSHGVARPDGETVRLTLDGRGPGIARAYSPGTLDGDFDVTISVQPTLSASSAGDHVRVWSLALVDSREQAVGFMCETRERGTRYGLLRDNREGYTPPIAANHWIPEREWGDDVNPTSLKVRLKREAGLVSTYFWRENEWQPVRPNHAGHPLGGPVFLRYEAYNGDEKTQQQLPLEVAYTLERVQSLEPDQHQGSR